MGFGGNNAREVSRAEFNRVSEMTGVLAQEVLQLKRGVADSTVEVGTVTLGNTLAYPFNNSVVTVALKTPRNNLDYTVTVEHPDDPRVGEIKVYDKQTNGFKLECEGEYSSVTLKYYVSGGMV